MYFKPDARGTEYLFYPSLQGLGIEFQVIVSAKPELGIHFSLSPSAQHAVGGSKLDDGILFPCYFPVGIEG